MEICDLRSKVKMASSEENSALEHLDSASVLSMVRRLQVEPSCGDKHGRDIPAAFTSKATAKLRGYRVQRDYVLIDGDNCEAQVWIPEPKVRACIVERLKIGMLVTRADAMLQASVDRARSAAESNSRGDADSWLRRRAVALKSRLATRYVESVEFIRADALLRDGSAMLAEILERGPDGRLRRSVDSLLAPPLQPEPLYHRLIRNYLADTRQAVRQYQAQVDADPGGAAIRNQYRTIVFGDSGRCRSAKTDDFAA